MSDKEQIKKHQEFFFAKAKAFTKSIQMLIQVIDITSWGFSTSHRHKTFSSKC
ncbi:MAG: hypothetical protein H6772_01845 [Pseudomonadales bacterium]|nr:hypothetical protein [Pseudomonadales bacterium]